MLLRQTGGGAAADPPVGEAGVGHSCGVRERERAYASTGSATITSFARGSRSMPGTWWKSDTAPAPMMPYRTWTSESSFVGRTFFSAASLYPDHRARR